MKLNGGANRHAVYPAAASAARIPPMHTRLLPLYLCFFLSGSAALIYEIVWQRMLTLVFGVSTWSIAAVLSAYMAGLALGAWAFGRLADRTHHVVRAYGLVELGILLTGIAVSWSIDPLMAVYVKLAGGSEHGYYFTHLIRFALALAVFVVPSTLIGGTIPLMSRMVARHAGALGIGFGRFYADQHTRSGARSGVGGICVDPLHRHARIHLRRSRRQRAGRADRPDAGFGATGGASGSRHVRTAGQRGRQRGSRRPAGASAVPARGIGRAVRIGLRGRVGPAAGGVYAEQRLRVHHVTDRVPGGAGDR
jgi:hypothetical protein